MIEIRHAYFLIRENGRVYVEHVQQKRGEASIKSRIELRADPITASRGNRLRLTKDVADALIDSWSVVPF